MNTIGIKVVHVSSLPGSYLIRSYLSRALNLYPRWGWLVMECFGEFSLLSPSGHNPITMLATFEDSARKKKISATE